MGWLIAVTTVLQLLPTLINSVKEIVRAIDSDGVPGIGGQKKEYAMSVIRSGLDAADELSTDGEAPDTRIKETTMNICSGLIDSQVAFDKSVQGATK